MTCPFLYRPNPAHKLNTSEAGPPRWAPDKEKCPADLTPAECRELLAQSIPLDGDSSTPRRFALRRVAMGLEFYESKLTLELPDGQVEVHGHPTRRVPPRILRQMRDVGLLTNAEYRSLRREVT
jgi:hypothetical protein